MKKLSSIVLVLSMTIGFKASAQETILTEINYNQLQKYIQLAKDYYPKRKIAAAQADAAKIGIPIAQLSYLDIFNGSYFYRPEGKTVLDPANPYNFNGFQFGINVNLGGFLQKPFMVKKAKAEYKIAQLQNQDNDVLLETEVKKRYYTYIQMATLLKISTQTAQDNKNISENSKSKFEKGEIGLDAYNNSRMLLSASNTDKIKSEFDYLVAKDALEEIIGKKLSEVK